VAAGCLYALDHNVARLAEDHDNARLLADGLAELGCEVVPPETNIVIVAPPAGFAEALGRRGVELSSTPDGRVRAVTHLDVSRADVELALTTAREVLADPLP
jgi:threonine aldolase